MKFHTAAIALTILGASGMNPDSNAASPNEKTNIVANVGVPVPKLLKTIDLSDLGSSSVIKKMTFSPDGRYLAIVDNPMHMQTDIVVWDLQLDKKQSHIHCPYNYGDLSDHDLLWSRDGKIISFGAKRQWDPMSGAALPDNPAIGRAARLNKDGSKMLTIVGAIGEPSYLHIYDTKDWTLKKVYVDGLAVQTAAWTAEDKILVGVRVTKEVFGKTIDGHLINQGSDVALRLLDPFGNEHTKAVWFPAVPDDRPQYFPWKQAIDVELFAVNFVTNQIALGAGRIINGKTLEIITYYSIEDIVSDRVSTGTGGMVFDPNGKYLYIKSGAWFDNRKPVENTIIDTTSGKKVAQFSGGDIGISISADSRQLAIGNQRSVQILSLQ